MKRYPKPKIGDLALFGSEIVGLIIGSWENLDGSNYYYVEWYEGDKSWTTSYSEGDISYLCYLAKKYATENRL